MSRTRAGLLLGLVAALLLLVRLTRSPEAPVAEDAPASRRVRLAVLGNSDSHAFHDSTWFAPGSPERGGAYRAVSLQWTEVLARLRGDAIDQGAWGTRGHSARRARVAGWVGLDLRTPRKTDFAWNYAVSGARCRDLGGPRGQATQLGRAIAADPDAWAGAVVVVRIGINDLGRREVLEQVARQGGAAFLPVARECAALVRRALDALRAAQPGLRVVVVGLYDNIDWPPNFDLFRSAESMREARAVFDAFDRELEAWAARTPQAVFLADRGWAQALWGGRSPDGTPAYRDAVVGPLTVRFAQGDAPSHAFVADGHAGTVFNTLWAQRLLLVLHDLVGPRIVPISDAERDAFLADLTGR